MNSTLLLAPAAVGAGATANAITFSREGADSGHNGFSRDAPADALPTGFCDFTPVALTSAISCARASAASPTYDWHLLVPVTSTSSSTVTNLKYHRGGMGARTSTDPNQTMGARTISWNASGALTCNTSFVTWSRFHTLSAKAVAARSVAAGADRPETDIFIGRADNQSSVNDPRAFSVSYSY